MVHVNWQEVLLHIQQRWGVFVNAMQGAESLKYNFLVRYSDKLKWWRDRNSNSTFEKVQNSFKKKTTHTLVGIVCNTALDLHPNRKHFCLCFIMERQQQSKQNRRKGKGGILDFLIMQHSHCEFFFFSQNLSGEKWIRPSHYNQTQMCHQFSTHSHTCIPCSFSFS